MRVAPIGVYLAGNCGSNGTCGKCRVLFLSEPPAPSEADRKLLSADSLARGERLACKVQAAAGMRVEIIAPDESAMKVEASFSLPRQPQMENTPGGASPDVDYTGRIVAAVDIGTTTIAMSAVDSGTGQVLQTVTGVNHQRAWGADVISRMEASNQGKGEELRQSILSDLDQLRERLGLPADVKMLISGNTTMEHLL